MTCAVDSKHIADLVRNVVGRDKWHVVRITNNIAYGSKAICLIKYVESLESTYWARVEVTDKCNGRVFYYHVNELNFVDFEFGNTFDDIEGISDELNLLCC